MNDRFKLRFWDKREKEYFTCGNIDHKSGIFKTHPYRTYNWCLEHKNIIAEQCTGLKDKNGKLIYEGDILTDGANTFIVNWYDDMALFRLLYKNDNRETYCLFYPDDATSKYTVIGNIHEETENG